MNQCLLTAGGAADVSLLKKIYLENDFTWVFAIDRGLEALIAAGIRPTHVIGDFDSVRPDVLADVRPDVLADVRPDVLADDRTAGERILQMIQSGEHGDDASQMKNGDFARPWVERLAPEKDDTDTEHAMRRAAELHPDEIVLTGGFGTRFDHVLANVHTLLIPLRAGIPASMVDETNRIRLLEGGKLCIKKEDAWGKYVSLLPLTTEVTGITLTGFKYPLKHASFHIGGTISLGVSNELAADEGIIEAESGVLAVIESADAPLR